MDRERAFAHTGVEPKRRARADRRAALLLVTATLLTATAVGAAQAQVEQTPDTELTPTPKDPVQWSIVSGAKYRGEGRMVTDPNPSPAPYTVDFFTTSISPSFIEEEANLEGFFGGAECFDPEDPLGDPDIPFEDEALNDCARRPAVYRYWIDGVGDEHIDKVPTDELLDDVDEEGFVGAVAWIDATRALAVGGTRRYPRREPRCPEEDPCTSDDEYRTHDEQHGAGMARAWIYEDADEEGETDDVRHWRELEQLPDGTDGDELPDGMAGMTALECAYQPEADKLDPSQLHAVNGTCVAGGLQRMWWWRPAEGGKSEGFDPDAVTNLEVKSLGTGFSVVKTPDTPDFHHRVRQIRFSSLSSTSVAAVTAGCCLARTEQKIGADAQLGTEASPALGGRMLTYSADQDKWTSNKFSDLADSGAAGAPVPDSVYSIATLDEILNCPACSGGNVVTKAYTVSGVLAPGGDPAPGSEEPGSLIKGGRDLGNLDAETSHAALESVRLVAADGDFQTAKSPTYDSVSGAGERLQDDDALLDWAVGSVKQGSTDGTAQGVVYTTLEPHAVVPSPLSCPLAGGEGSFTGNQGGNCEVALENITNASLKSKRLIGMGTYALNSLQFIFRTNRAWAAGDRGAIARLGAAGAIGAEVEPLAPYLRPGEQEPLAQRGPFESLRPGSATPGIVPSRSAQPVEKLPRPEIVPYGSADPSRFLPAGLGDGGLPYEGVTAMAMSRDGAEGWAVGSGPYLQKPGGGIGPADTFTLQRFDGERWTRCAVDGLGGAYEPDPACASLAWLAHAKSGQQRVNLVAIARIPLERDGDPSNDDEFAAIAVGQKPAEPDGRGFTVLHYRDGAWTLDEAASRVASDLETSAYSRAESSIVFRRPDDGWFWSNLGCSCAGGPQLFHYGGADWPHGRWVRCTTGSGGVDVAHADECGGAGGIQRLSNRLGVQHGQLQVAGDTVFIAGNRRGASGKSYPFVYSKQPGQPWLGEYDPGCDQIVNGSCQARPPQETDPLRDPDPLIDEDQGVALSFSAVDLGGGRIAGWLLGSFASAGAGVANSNDFSRSQGGPKYVLMRRDAAEPPGSTEAWSYHQADDAADDFLSVALFDAAGWNKPPRLVSFRGGDGLERSFITTAGNGPYWNVGFTHNPPLEYDAEKGRWQVMPAPFLATGKIDSGPGGASRGEITAMAPDNQGGAWIAVRAQHLYGDEDFSTGGKYHDTSSHTANYYYRYTDRRPTAVFEDSPSPVSEEITDLDGTSEGTVWVSTESDRLYRYDRMVGWERVRIPRWDPGRVVTRRSKAYSVAVNESGVGIAVGEEGRIADISPSGVTLDPATVHRCSEAPPPCGTPRTFRAAAVASDGSALAGGDRLTLSWRPAGGSFRLVTAPLSTTTTTITGLSMPDPEHVWAALDNGEVWAGTLVDPAGKRPWRWVRESSRGAARDERGVSHLFGIEVDSHGRGLAVGTRGAMLERSPDGTWERLITGYLDNFVSVALPPGGYGDGALVGGGSGVILTRDGGNFGVARAADHLDPLVSDGVEIYDGRIVGLAISGGPKDRDTEAWAASQVNYDENLRRRDPPPHVLFHYASGDEPLLHPETRAAPLSDAPAERPDEVSLAAFGRSECTTERCAPLAGNNVFNDLLARRINTEIIDRADRSTGPVAAVSTGDLNESPGREQNTGLITDNPIHTVNEPNIAHDQWRQFVADPLLESGVPVFGTPGEHDLSRVRRSPPGGSNEDSNRLIPGGLTSQWRQSFATMPAPWGSGDPVSARSFEYRPVEVGSAARQDHPEGGARTHYALDLVKEGRALARLVFIDSSNAHSLSASDPNQNPVEEQQAWLDAVLDRPEGLPAVVVTTTPTYSYGPGSVEQTLTEATAFEATLIRHRVSALIAGHMGWNGLYYACAPAVHTPRPGGEHPLGPPQSAAECGGAAGGAEDLPDPSKLIETPVSGLLPAVIASSAGGQFGPRGDDVGTGPEGFWHGYSVVRIPPDGDPAKVVVEQRPILDWVNLTASRHVLRAGQRLELEGTGREPLGVDTTAHINEINNPAITHRYDLVEADPERPWEPKEAEDNGVENQASTRLGEEDPCGPYRCLAPSIGTIEEQTGRVKAGNGNYPRTYALAVLSVGDETATWPLVFEPRASYRPPVASIPRPSLPPPPPYPSQPPQPGSVSVEPPPPPVLPPTQTALTPEPIVPPTPPSYGNASPIDLGIAPVAIVAPPPTVVLQPPNPVVQPAPPSGARREARQRQAATQKSGMQTEEAQDGAGDLAQGPEAPTGTGMTRHEHQFTALAHNDQPSAWVRDAMIGGGLGIAALVLALGLSGARPTPRRRQPEAPAPAWARPPRRR